MISIIVPVYNAPDDLRCCLESLAATLDHATEVVVIDDASPDTTIAPMLRELANWRGPRWNVIRQEKNRGFVATVNHGMRMTAGDVVLLNSDTRVTRGWLDRLQSCAASDKRIATITPLTNNGEIASFPMLCQNNPWPDDPDSIARACRESGSPVYPDAPTAVGFCMWIRRAAINALGYFDEAAFGRGYGEENDFSCRAAQAGWRNVICDDGFVAHRGGASFAPLGIQPNGKALEEVQRRFPDYLKSVREFIRTDPLKARRKQISECISAYNSIP